MRAFAILLLATSIAAAADLRDGTWWRAQARPAKVSYVIGLADGWRSGVEARTSDEDSPRILFNSYLAERTPGQLADGLDAFYGDFRNRGISVADALWPVAMAARGADAQTLDSYVAQLRGK